MDRVELIVVRVVGPRRDLVVTHGQVHKAVFFLLADIHHRRFVLHPVHTYWNICERWGIGTELSLDDIRPLADSVDAKLPWHQLLIVVIHDEPGITDILLTLFQLLLHLRGVFSIVDETFFVVIECGTLPGNTGTCYDRQLAIDIFFVAAGEVEIDVITELVSLVEANE